jgi:hypothetical protein
MLAIQTRAPWFLPGNFSDHVISVTNIQYLDYNLLTVSYMYANEGYTKTRQQISLSIDRADLLSCLGVLLVCIHVACSVVE